ncbi:MAG: WbuC family cupin fold metalloprotein [Pseudomonadota bacterium]
MKYNKINDEVFYITDDIAEISSQDMEELKKKSKLNTRKTARICVHQGIEHSLHEMFIVHNRGAYVRPHQHVNKIESFHIINGDADIIIFDDHGIIINVLEMGTHLSGKTFFCRLPEKCYHTIFVNSKTLMVHEITNGPFIKGQTIFADWAPLGTDSKNAEKFMKNIKKQTIHFISKKKNGTKNSY